MTSRLLWLSLHLSALLGAGISHAESFEPADAQLIEGVAVIPTITLTESYDDNVINDEQGSVNSYITTLQPEIALISGDDISRLALRYRLEAARYHQSDADDYLDQLFTVVGQHEFTARHRLSGSYQYEHEHEARGTGLTEDDGNAIDSPIEYDVSRANVTYGFGVREAILNLDAKVDYGRRAYTNFEELTRFRDRDNLRYGVTGYWNLSGRTSLLLDLSEEAVRYDTADAAGASQDSDVRWALGGVRWEISGKTTGYAKAGWQSKDFDDELRSDFDGFAWDVGAEWLPLSYSKLTLEGGKAAKDPDTDGDYVDETSVTLSWRHGWLERLATTFGTAYVGRDYTGIDRNDDLYVVRIGGDYSFRRWMRLGVGYEFRDQRSTRDSIEYDKNLVYLLLELGL